MERERDGGLGREREDIYFVVSLYKVCRLGYMYTHFLGRDINVSNTHEV